MEEFLSGVGWLMAVIVCGVAFVLIAVACAICALGIHWEVPSVERIGYSGGRTAVSPFVSMIGIGAVNPILALRSAPSGKPTVGVDDLWRMYLTDGEDSWGDGEDGLMPDGIPIGFKCVEPEEVTASEITDPCELREMVVASWGEVKVRKILTVN